MFHVSHNKSTSSPFSAEGIEDSTPGDHTFFLGKNRFRNTSCVSNMFFLKKNEKILSKKNIIKMNHFIPIFLLYKMVYFTGKKNV